MAAFGLTIPYQQFVTISPLVLAFGMQILCIKSLSRGDLREANGNFSLAMATALALMISLTVDYLQAFSLSLPPLALVT